MQTIDFDTLARMAAVSEAVTLPCSCTQESLAAWRAVPLALDASQLEEVGVLFDDPYDEPTFAEYHPAGTRYESTDAPIAVRFYPYNRCAIVRCRLCARHYLRYNEAGGYFTEIRMRALQPELLSDASA